MHILERAGQYVDVPSTKDPLFLYLSITWFTNPASQASKRYTPTHRCAQRKMLQAMVSVVDALVYNLTNS